MSDWEPVSTIMRLPPATAAVPAENRALGVLLDDGMAGRPVHVEHLPPRAGREAPWPPWVPAEIIGALAGRGIHAPWSHQADAAGHAQAGRNVIICTGAASGKSLSYLLPALTAVLSGETVLYVAPTKALAADQLASIRALALPGIQAAAFDGDSTAAERAWARSHARYLLTTPDMLHRSLLPGHARWSGFFSRLRYVIIDECHEYRGVFGSHVGHVLRRLRRVVAHHAPAGGPSRPVFVLASATVGAPGTCARLLTGLDAEEVTEDGSPRGPVAFALWEPPLTDARGEAGARLRRTATAQTADLLARLVRQDVPTLAFIRSRRGAEAVALAARRALGGREAPAAKVAAYRSGYLPEDRRDLEAALARRAPGRPGRHDRARAGDQHHRPGRGAYRGLARNLGVALAAGGPGRAGGPERGGGPHRPGRPARHLPRPAPRDPAAPPGGGHRSGSRQSVRAGPAPVRRRGRAGPDRGGPGDLRRRPARQVVEQLTASGRLRRRPAGWHSMRRGRAGPGGLRGAGDAPVRVVEEATGRLVGTVDEPSAQLLVHDGAVYLHQGESYVVATLDLADRVALVEPGDPGYTTTARDVTEIEVRGTLRAATWGEAEVGFGDVRVTRQVMCFTKRRSDTGAPLGETPLDLPPRHLVTRAVWWTVSAAGRAALAAAGVDLGGAAHAAEHASIGLLPLFATCDRWDIGGVSADLHPATGRLSVFVFDGYDGGAGFAERGFQAARDWLGATRQAIAGCDCEAGCPSCVQSPKCGTANRTLSKRGAVALLDAVLAGSA